MRFRPTAFIIGLIIVSNIVWTIVLPLGDGFIYLYLKHLGNTLLKNNFKKCSRKVITLIVTISG